MVSSIQNEILLCFACVVSINKSKNIQSYQQLARAEI